MSRPPRKSRGRARRPPQRPLPPDLAEALSEVLLSDEPRLRRQWDRLPGTDAKQGEAARAEFDRALAASRSKVAARRSSTPTIHYPPDLPVSGRADDLAAAIREHQVVVICGETGSGKTTQLPKICLDLGRGTRGLIGHTQPRRLAARAVAARIAEELGEPLGGTVGFKVRFTDRTGPNCRVKLMTDGILLAEIRRDRDLRQYDTLIIDEAHERSLNIDFLLGILKRLLPRRPDLRVLITSATIDPEGLAKHFGGAPVVEVSGRTWPVEVRHRPPAEADAGEQLPALLAAVDELTAEPGGGDVLVFLPGERDIRETAVALGRHAPGIEILPLFARLSAAEQDRVFRTGKARRVILSTNIAETSLTVPGIRFVIDPGRARISRYSYRSKIQRLQIENISQASARQRQGRCGRLRDGVAIRLYDEDDFEARPAFTDPEILRTNLASVILSMADLKLGRIEDFPFLDSPDPRFVRDGYRLLSELGAVDDAGNVTRQGHDMARLPIDPRLSRILIAAGELGCLSEALVITSLLSIRDPRERPLEKAAQADLRHAAWQMPNSDFSSALKLWQAFNEQRRLLSGSKLRKWARENFLSFLRLREWRDVHSQLETQCREMGLKPGASTADYEVIHRALLTGFLGHIGQREEERRYLGPRNRRFVVSPGSVLHKKPPNWLAAASLVETTRVFAHVAARVEPAWIEAAGGDLVRRSYESPAWDPRRGHVVARESVSLYGLLLASGRRVDFGRVDPAAARRIFIEEALVEGRHTLAAPFVRHNRDLRQAVRDVEDRLRRRDLLADGRQIGKFFDERIASDVCDLRGFEQWRKKAEAGNAKLLFMSRSDLLTDSLPTPNPDDWPDAVTVEGNRLPLSYRFEPGADDDGVTMTVPASLLAMLDDGALEWLVPGLLDEKLIAMIRALPKSLRRRLVPAPDVAQRCREQLTPADGSLYEQAARALTREAGVTVPGSSWHGADIPAHLLFNIQVLNETGEPVANGRDLSALRGRFGRRGPVAGGEGEGQGRSGMTDWEVGELPRTVQVRDAGGARHLYPALHDDVTTVSLRYFANRDEAASAHRQAVLRLYQLALGQEKKYLKKTFSRMPELAGGGELGLTGSLIDDLVSRAFEDTFLTGGDPPVRGEAAYRQRLAERRGQVVATGTELASLMTEILARRRSVRRQLATGLKGPGADAAAAAIDEQLDHLLARGFLRRTPAPWLAQLPRYLSAIEVRIDKLAAGHARDAQLEAEIRPFWERWLGVHDKGESDPEFAQFRWMIEEFRVSLFAQPLGTSIKVSAARLEKQWRRAGSHARRAH